MLKELLTQCGLTDSESAIYSLLIEQGDNPASLISKQMQINRSSCYSALEKLNTRGFISRISKNSTTYFSANDPYLVLANLQSQKQSELQQINLMKARLKVRGGGGNSPLNIGSVHNKSKVYFCSGDQNIKNLFQKFISVNGNLSRFFLTRNFYQSYQLSDWLPQSALGEEKLRQILITRDNYSSFAGNLPLDNNYLQFKTIQGIFDLGIDLLISQEQIAIISLSEDFGILIDSPLIAKAKSKIFDFFWKIGSPLHN